MTSEPPPPVIAARTGCWASLWSELKNPGTATGVIGIVIGVIGIVLAIYFHYKSEKFSEVEMFVEQIQVFDKTKSGVVPLRVLDAFGNQIDNNIFAASITIWNSGNVEIKKEDVRQPFRLSVRGGDSNVIDITPLFYSKENIDGFSVDHNNGEINWHHFDAGEGLKVRIIYTSSTMQSVELSGRAVGTAVFDSQELQQKSTINKTIDKWASIAITSVLILMIVANVFYRWQLGGLVFWMAVISVLIYSIVTTRAPSTPPF